MNDASARTFILFDLHITTTTPSFTTTAGTDDDDYDVDDDVDGCDCCCVHIYNAGHNYPVLVVASVASCEMVFSVLRINCSKVVSVSIGSISCSLK